jgi:purine nucleosidase
MAVARIPVLLDTDIGSDIDDAVCLSYLLSQPRCELVGVTTVTGRPRARAALVSAICSAAGRDDVAIHAGTEAALLSATTPQPDVPQAVVLDRCEHRPAESFQENTAVDFIRDAVRARPGELTLLAIGPLTNVALAFATYPDLAASLRALVIMGGSFFGRSPGTQEWNIRCDPVAGRAVYGTRVARHASIGLDVSTRCAMPAREAVERFTSLGGAWGVVASMADVWAAEASSVVFHDPLAAVTIFSDHVCTWSDGQVSVDLSDGDERGATTFHPAGPDTDGRAHTVASDVDVDRFFAELFSPA